MIITTLLLPLGHIPFTSMPPSLHSSPVMHDPFEDVAHSPRCCLTMVQVSVKELVFKLWKSPMCHRRHQFPRTWNLRTCLLYMACLLHHLPPSVGLCLPLLSSPPQPMGHRLLRSPLLLPVGHRLLGLFYTRPG
jgi:hypothetical protein